MYRAFRNSGAGENVRKVDNVFIGRAQEIKFLEEYYRRENSDVVIVYGRKGIGKTELLRGVGRNKAALYYNARECSMKEQLLTMQREWKEIYGLGGEEGTFESLLLEAAGEYSFLVIDEFHLIMKNREQFMTDVLLALKESKKTLVILCSSSVNWVENDMVNSMGQAALSISAFLKIKEFTFADMVSRYPDYSVEQCIGVYGVLGGVPGYLSLWNEKRSLKENIMALFLHKDGRLYRENENFLRSELRELSLYNTILAVLAEGKLKLNDIYERTGFSRAKISVYIKNLIELDIVEKVFSYDTDGKENTKKGLYRIKDRCLNFWYRFVFPNLSKLEMRKIDEVYKENIAPCLDEYLENYFSGVCQEYISLMSDYDRLPFKIKRSGPWFGKEGTLDFIGEGEDGTIFAGKCKWSSEPVSEQDFEHMLELTRQALIEPDYYYLFTKNGYTTNFEVMARGMDNLVLTKLSDM